MKASLKEELFSGLRALEETMFPKRCASCGRVYKTLDDFLAQTQDLDGSSGVVNMGGHRRSATVGVFRNCVCRSTLLVPCKDRRGRTPHQLKRRRIFGHLLDTLEKTGWKRSEARQELAKLMRGEKSEIMQIGKA